jgi:DNA modification methylase
MEASGERKGRYLTHKSKVLSDPLPTSVLDIPSSWCFHKLDEKINHRTSKPVSLMEFLLKYWTKEGWTVLDPTMGSGSMGVACKRMNRKFIGIEKDDDIFELAKKRIEDEKK